jgi:hypothetical protein
MTAVPAGSVSMNRSNRRRVSRLRSVIRPARFATATSNTSFARSTATVVASILASSWWRGATHEFTAMMPRNIREESMPSLQAAALSELGGSGDTTEGLLTSDGVQARLAS